MRQPRNRRCQTTHSCNHKGQVVAIQVCILFKVATQKLYTRRQLGFSSSPYYNLHSGNIMIGTLVMASSVVVLLSKNSLDQKLCGLRIMMIKLLFVVSA